MKGSDVGHKCDTGRDGRGPQETRSGHCRVKTAPHTRNLPRELMSARSANPRAARLIRLRDFRSL